MWVQWLWYLCAVAVVFVCGVSAVTATCAGPQQESAGGSVLSLCHSRGGGLHGAGTIPRRHSAGYWTTSWCTLCSSACVCVCLYIHARVCVGVDVCLLQVPGQEPAHPLRCHRYSCRLRGQPSQQASEYLKCVVDVVRTHHSLPSPLSLPSPPPSPSVSGVHSVADASADWQVE